VKDPLSGWERDVSYTVVDLFNDMGRSSTIRSFTNVPNSCSGPPLTQRPKSKCVQQWQMENKVVDDPPAYNE